MADLTKVYRIVFNDGANHNALVFQEPTEGKSYQAHEVIFFGDEGQTSFAPTNDEGDIPHLEPADAADGNLGITWHFAK